MRAAQALESAFLAEMLKGAGLAEPPGSFGGGAGEAQFASFLREAYAGALVRAGGIGLAERLFEALRRESGTAAAAPGGDPAAGGDGRG
jgi:Rod binding domain-containing protein